MAAAAAAGLETGLEEEPYVEEYTTAAYEMQQRKRSLGILYSDDSTEPQLTQPLSPAKQARVVLQPAEAQEVYHSPLAPVRLAQTSLSSTERSRRMLEAAGLFSSQKERTVNTGSVFSRLGNTSDSLQVSPSPRPVAVSTSVAAKPRTVKLSPAATSVGSAGSGSAGRRELKITKVAKPRTVIATTSKPRGVSAGVLAGSGSKLPGRVSNQPGVTTLGAEVKPAGGVSGAMRVRSTSEGGGGTSRTLRVTSSRQEDKPLGSTPGSRLRVISGKPSGSMSGRLGVRSARGEERSLGSVSSRLGAREEGRTAGSRSTRPGARPVAKEMGRPSGSMVSRLGDREDRVRAAKPAVTDVSPRSKPSMVADEYEYEMKRQLDIRSRLERREQEKHARRKQPLAGRLEKHHVFGRLE